MLLRHRPLNEDSTENQNGINMVDLMMWLVIAALLLAAAIQGIGYYQKAAALNTMKSDLDGAGSLVMSSAANTGKITRETAEEGLTSMKWSPEVNGVIQDETESGVPYLRATHPQVANSDVIYLFEACGSEYDIGVNVIPKDGNVILEECGIDPYMGGGGSASTSEPLMVTVWDTRIAGCSTIYLPIQGGTNNVKVNWGDGTPEATITSPYWGTNHDYTDTPGLKTITLNGTFTKWGSSYGLQCLTEVTHWGETGTTSLEQGFQSATNLTKIARIPNGVTNLNNTFRSASNFNIDIGNWDTSKVTTMQGTFADATAFNQNINNWNVSNVVYMSEMFYNATKFNQPLNKWNTSKVQKFRATFYNATSFNQNINDWNVTSVDDLSGAFSRATAFDQPLDRWVTSSLTTTQNTFAFASSFKQNINNWNMTKVTDMSGMFSNTYFNQPLDKWDTSNVTKMGGMFDSASFNQPLNSWNTSNVTNMTSMFRGSRYSHPLNSWNTSNVTSMNSMFMWSNYNQDLSMWTVAKVTDHANFPSNTLSPAHYPNFPS